MPIKAFLCLSIILAAASLTGVITEDSASANALSGITLLSESVSDFSLSPAIGRTGFAFSYHFPFSIAGCGVYSLNTASLLSPFVFSSGASFINQEDYRWQDFHLGLALHYQELGIGYAEHLIYERISTDDSYHTWTGDLALTFRGEDYGTEIKLLHMGAEDSELHLSVSSLLAPGVRGASTYVYVPHGEDSYRVATSYDIADTFLMQASWQNCPPRFGIGLKFYLGSGEIMYSIRSHAELNLSHSLDVGINW